MSLNVFWLVRNVPFGGFRSCLFMSPIGFILFRCTYYSSAMSPYSEIMSWLSCEGSTERCAWTMVLAIQEGPMVQ